MASPETPNGTRDARCPLDGSALATLERVREERVPATVPDYFTRSQEAPYRRVDSYELVRCERGHTFKRKPGELRGMAA